MTRIAWCAIIVAACFAAAIVAWDRAIAPALGR